MAKQELVEWAKKIHKAGSYKNSEVWDYSWNGSYCSITDCFGNVLLQETLGSYQGDIVLLYEKDGKFGYLIFGYGSCSGCDSLEACSSFEGIAELYERLEGSVQWWDSAKEALDYFEQKDWSTDYGWHEDGFKEFVEKCQEILRSRI
jgi:hypothetical protein